MYEDRPTSSTVGTERSRHVHFAVEDCNYRHSYPSSKNIVGKRKGSAPIPIASQSMRKSTSAYWMAQDEAEADDKDFTFFSRVVDGISRQNSLLEDGSYLKTTNESLLDNIVKARFERDGKEIEDVEGFHNRYYYTSRLQIHHDMKIVTRTKDDPSMNVIPDGSDHFQNDYEDEGIFDFEL